MFGSLLHLQRRKSLPVKGSKTAGCINSSQIAAQHHFIFGNITIVRQQLQISTVARYILFIYTQKPQNTAAAFGNNVISHMLKLPSVPEAASASIAGCTACSKGVCPCHAEIGESPKPSINTNKERMFLLLP